jgi:hypothetical protein
MSWGCGSWEKTSATLWTGVSFVSDTRAIVCESLPWTNEAANLGGFTY